MCWVTRKPPVKLNATDDVIVYKVALNVTYKGFWIFKKYLTVTSMVKGYIYYCNRSNPTVKLEVNTYANGVSIISEGYHSYLCKSSAELPFFYCIECVIPKGSTYYVNECGEVVSDKIIITDKIKKC